MKLSPYVLKQAIELIKDLLTGSKWNYYVVTVLMTYMMRDCLI